MSEFLRSCVARPIHAGGTSCAAAAGMNEAEAIRARTSCFRRDSDFMSSSRDDKTLTRRIIILSSLSTDFTSASKLQCAAWPSEAGVSPCLRLEKIVSQGRLSAKFELSANVLLFSACSCHAFSAPPRDASPTARVIPSPDEEAREMWVLPSNKINEQTSREGLIERSSDASSSALRERRISLC